MAADEADGEQLDLFGDAEAPRRAVRAARSWEGRSEAAPSGATTPAAAAAASASAEVAATAATTPPIAAERLPRSWRTLEALRGAALGCTQCALRAGCQGVVFGEGDPHARLMLIGEGPGATEDELGRPFVGRAGELLDRILAAAGFRREEVFISNVVMCQPAGNRTPTPEETAACRPWLEAKLALVAPAIVVALGATATKALIDPAARITQVRGRWFERSGYRIMPTYHPAALLRDPGKKRPVWTDFQAVRDACQALPADWRAEGQRG